MSNYRIFHSPSKVPNPHEINKIRGQVQEHKTKSPLNRVLSLIRRVVSLYDRDLLSPTPHDWCVVAESRASDGQTVKKWTVF